MGRDDPAQMSLKSLQKYGHCQHLHNPKRSTNKYRLIKKPVRHRKTLWFFFGLWNRCSRAAQFSAPSDIHLQISIGGSTYLLADVETIAVKWFSAPFPKEPLVPPRCVANDPTTFVRAPCTPPVTSVLSMLHKKSVWERMWGYSSSTCLSALQNVLTCSGNSAWIFLMSLFSSFWNFTSRRREQNARVQSSLGSPLTNGVPCSSAIVPAADLRASSVWAKPMAARTSSRFKMSCSVWAHSWSGRPARVPLRPV